MLPQSNGQLLRIDDNARSEDWDEAAGAGAAKWSGPAPTYVQNKIRTVFNQNEGALIRFRDTTLFIDETLPVEIENGDIVTWRDSKGEHSNKVQDYTLPTLPQIPTGQSYMRLILEPQRVEA